MSFNTLSKTINAATATANVVDAAKDVKGLSGFEVIPKILNIFKQVFKALWWVVKGVFKVLGWFLQTSADAAEAEMKVKHHPSGYELEPLHWAADDDGYVYHDGRGGFS